MGYPVFSNLEWSNSEPVDTWAVVSAQEYKYGLY